MKTRQIIPAIIALLCTLPGYFACERIEHETKIGALTILGTTSHSVSVNAVFNDFSEKVTDFGLCWSSTGTPTVNDQTKLLGQIKYGKFTNSIEGLEPNTSYTLCAYVIEGEKPVYGEPENFNTSKANLEINIAKKELGNNEGSFTFELTSDTDWEIKITNTGWLSIDPQTGTGNKTITVNYTENMDFGNRSAILTIEGNGADDQILTINQLPADVVLEVVPIQKTVSAAQGIFSFEITSNINWTIEAPDSWFSITPLSGNGSKTFVLNYQENKEVQDRSVTIGVTPRRVVAEKQELILTQLSPGVILTLSEVSEQTNMLSSSGAGSFTFKIITNINWEIAETPEWLGVDNTNGNGDQTIVVTYTENALPQQRSHTITIKSVGATTENQTLLVVQPAALET